MQVAHKPEFRPRLAKLAHFDQSALLAQLMSDCWAHQPSHRPNFARILERLQRMEEAAIACEKASAAPTFGALPLQEISGAAESARSALSSLIKRNSEALHAAQSTPESPMPEQLGNAHAQNLTTPAPVDIASRENPDRKIRSPYESTIDVAVLENIQKKAALAPSLDSEVTSPTTAETVPDAGVESTPRLEELTLYN